MEGQISEPQTSMPITIGVAVDMSPLYVIQLIQGDFELYLLPMKLSTSPLLVLNGALLQKLSIEIRGTQKTDQGTSKYLVKSKSWLLPTAHRHM